MTLPISTGFVKAGETTGLVCMASPENPSCTDRHCNIGVGYSLVIVRSGDMSRRKAIVVIEIVILGILLAFLLVFVYLIWGAGTLGNGLGV
jgi:hypothetical protein